MDNQINGNFFEDIMKIRKAKEIDFEEYFKLKKQEGEDYSKIINEEIKYPRHFVKKRFNEFLKSRSNLIIVVEIEKELIGYIDAELYSNAKKGHITDLFVIKKYRKKGIATKLIKKFYRMLKKKGYKKLKLDVNPKNKDALSLYRKRGFKISSYGMTKRII